MHDGCVECTCADCKASPRLHEVVSCYTETFPAKAPDGSRFTIALRLCLSCGARFADRQQIREYLRTKLPAYALSAAEAAVAV